LDLGSGIGSIGLAWLAQRGAGARCTLLEAQEVSVALCQRTLSSQQAPGEDAWGCSSSSELSGELLVCEQGSNLFPTVHSTSGYQVLTDQIFTH